MAPSDSSSAGSAFEIPKWLKGIHDWGKIIWGIAAGVAAIASLVVSKEQAPFLGGLAAGLFVILYLVFLYTRHNRDVINKAEKINWPDTAPEGKGAWDSVKIDLKTSQKYSTWLIIILALVALFSLGFLLYQPLYYRFFTQLPETIQFQPLRAFDSSSDQALIKESPSLEAVVAQLNSEGKGEGRKTKIVVGRTIAFDYPTPSFQMRVSVEDQTYEIAGYAFRRHHAGNHLWLESVPASYPQVGLIVFAVPPCDPGDDIFFVARLSLKDKNALFPSNLQGIVQLSVVEVHPR